MHCFRFAVCTVSRKQRMIALSQLYSNLLLLVAITFVLFDLIPLTPSLRTHFPLVGKPLTRT